MPPNEFYTFAIPFDIPGTTKVCRRCCAVLYFRVSWSELLGRVSDCNVQQKTSQGAEHFLVCAFVNQFLFVYHAVESRAFTAQVPESIGIPRSPDRVVATHGQRGRSLAPAEEAVPGPRRVILPGQIVFSWKLNETAALRHNGLPNVDQTKL